MAMRTSADGIADIRKREGCRLMAYRDTVGVLTIGVGHTGRAAPPIVHEGMRITEAEADTILAADLVPFEAAINGAVRVPLQQGQFDACASLAFNIGAHGFVGSTVVHKLNAGDIAGAADAFLMWEKPQELRGRRIDERAQFLAHTASMPPVVSPGPVTVSAKPPAKAKGGKVAAGAVVVAGTVGAATASHVELQGLAWGFGIAAAVAVLVFLVLHFRKVK